MILHHSIAVASSFTSRLKKTDCLSEGAVFIDDGEVACFRQLFFHSLENMSRFQHTR